MNPEEGPEDDRFAALLASCSEALAAGRDTDPADDPTLPADLRLRLERALACLRRLRQAHLRPDPATTPAGPPPGIDLDGWAAGGFVGRFRILRVLGRGGGGTVFLAFDPDLHREVALKVPRLEALWTPDMRQRFLREARAAAAVRHDHIVHVNEVSESRGVPFLVMELLQGEPLDERLERVGALPVAEALRIAREVALGLAAAHAKGLIHRDIKPANVWLETPPHPQPLSPEAGERGSGGRVKILDFGLARAVEGDVNLTRAGAVLGTPAFMAPEQARGEPVDARADLFSLGCVLYRMLTGRIPFEGDTATAVLAAVEGNRPTPPRDLGAAIPPALSDLVLKLLARDRKDRPPSARAVVEAIESIERPPTAREGAAGVSQPPRPRVGGPLRSRGAVAFLALGLLVLLGVASYLIAHRSRPTPASSEGRAEPVSQEPTPEPPPPALPPGPRVINIPWVVGLEYIVFSPDSRFLVTAGTGGGNWNLVTWDVEAGTPAKHLEGFEGPSVPNVAWSPDGRWVATPPDATKTARLWGMPGANPAGPLEGHLYAGAGVAFSPDSRLLATASSDGVNGEVQLWDLTRPPPRRRVWPLPNLLVNRVAFVGGGKLLAMTLLDGTVRFWDVKTGVQRGKPYLIPTWGKKPGLEMAVTRDGQTVAVLPNGPPREMHVLSGKGGFLKKWPTGVKEDIGIRSQSFAPAGRTLAVGSGSSNQFRLWDVVTGKARTLPLLPDGLVSSALAFSPDGKTLAVAGYVPPASPGRVKLVLWPVASLEKNPPPP